ncbi:MAG: hypothetical protein AAF808_01670 [Cyanobacteria bacterium P01_D01_bin.2]
MGLGKLSGKRISDICLALSTLGGLSGFAPSLASNVYPHHLSTVAQDIATSPSSIVILHQGMSSHIDFFLQYGLNDGGSNLEDDTLIRDVAELLMNYPEDYDYWEIVNVSITQNLLEKYPQLDYITLQLEIHPRTRVPYHCVSTVTNWANGPVEESWRFEAHDIPVHDKTLTVSVNYTYQEAAVYPDFLDIHAQLSNYLNEPLQTNFPLSQLEDRLEQDLLQSYLENISGITVELK